jgi:hypothetical protein
MPKKNQRATSSKSRAENFPGEFHGEVPPIENEHDLDLAHEEEYFAETWHTKKSREHLASGSETDDHEKVVNTSPGSVSERKTKEQKATQKAAAQLPIIYVDPPKPGEKQKITVPPGGARVVVRGQEGEAVTMVPKKPKVQRQGTVRVVNATNGTQTYTDANGQVIVVQQQPQVVYAGGPYYDPYYCGYPYGYRRYGGYYGGYYGYPYAGFGTGLLLGAMLW